MLTISGKSNIAPFELKQKAEVFLKEQLRLILKNADNKLYISENELSIPVKKFTSDNPAVAYDFRKMLQADHYPCLTIKLLYAEQNGSVKINSKVKSIAYVAIEITGKTRPYSIPVITEITDKTIHITGTKRIDINDFGLKAPTNMFGLIKISEWINIEMDITLNYALIN